MQIATPLALPLFDVTYTEVSEVSEDVIFTRYNRYLPGSPLKA